MHIIHRVAFWIGRNHILISLKEGVDDAGAVYGGAIRAKAVGKGRFGPAAQGWDVVFGEIGGRSALFAKGLFKGAADDAGFDVF